LGISASPPLICRDPRPRNNGNLLHKNGWSAAAPWPHWWFAHKPQGWRFTSQSGSPSGRTNIRVRRLPSAFLPERSAHGFARTLPRLQATAPRSVDRSANQLERGAPRAAHAAGVRADRAGVPGHHVHRRQSVGPLRGGGRQRRFRSGIARS
jgi:hypothetical protein